MMWFGGYDGGRTHDFSAWVLLSEPDADGFHDVIPFYWIPGDTMEAREKEDRTTYRNWRSKNYLFTTEGNSISVPDIKDFILQTHFKLDIHETYYDPALFSGEMFSSLSENFPGKFVPFGQTIMNLSPPTKLLEGLVRKGKLRHGGHPVLRWNCRNAVIKIDANENIRVMKDNPKQRVDGMAALVNAIACYNEWLKKPKIDLKFTVL
jgi:phage terminase large subunit-like protein